MSIIVRLSILLVLYPSLWQGTYTADTVKQFYNTFCLAQSAIVQIICKKTLTSYPINIVATYYIITYIHNVIILLLCWYTISYYRIQCIIDTSIKYHQYCSKRRIPTTLSYHHHYTSPKITIDIMLLL